MIIGGRYIPNVSCPCCFRHPALITCGEAKRIAEDTRKTPAMPTPTDAERLDWLQAQHTLHRAVDILYVVDGYELSLVDGDNPPTDIYHGETLRDAIDLAMRNT